ncbi:ATP-binding protein [Haliscomenobacter sp.]|uniref:sensor histidine kinase n=1 Tax=Haliscomenobacter sp. TaxID=2717303 RepID=UPI0035946212
MKLKFKNRIALFNTIAVAITTAIVFVVIYLVVSQTALTHLDNDILTEKEEVFSNLDWHRDSIIINKMPEWDEAEHNKIEVNPTFLQIVNTKGKVVFHSSNLLKDQFFFNPHLDQELFYNSRLSNQKIRLGQFPIKNKNRKIIGQLTIAISRQESYAMLNSLLWILLISFPLVLIVLFIASSVAASKAIQPVHQLISTASKINDANIETRLRLPERKDELYDLTKTINELLARIEASMLQQKQFTSDASHEIRTPLTAIRGTLEVLIRKQREPKVYEEKITSIIQQVDRLNNLLEQLLQLARIESGAVAAKKETLFLSSIIHALHLKWREALAGRAMAFHVDVAKEATVTADKLFIELILDNLVSNAIKYGKEYGNIFIVWNEDLKTLSVKDDGIGILAQNLPNLFDRFYRADESRSSVIKGNGLGLSIVKKLCDLQSIKMFVESQPNEGSTFTLNFPR